MTTWTTRDGRELLISEMETSHIKNTINYLLDNPIAYGGGFSMEEFYYDINEERTNNYIKAFKQELKNRKE